MNGCLRGTDAYFILDVLAEMDLTAITQAVQAKDARGERPYPPAMMLALLIYGYCVGVFSSRRMARATYEDVGFRVLAAGEHPHFTRIAAFRRDHLAAFTGLFLQVLELCQKAGMVKLWPRSARWHRGRSEREQAQGDGLRANAACHKISKLFRVGPMRAASPA